MSKFYFSLFACFVISIASAQTITFPDPNFKAKLLAASSQANIAYNQAMVKVKIDTNNDGEIQVSEAANIYKLEVTVAGITDLSGIEFFTNLETLNAANNQIASFDPTVLPNLKSLQMYNNLLTSLNLNGMIQLENLDLPHNDITSLDLLQVPNLRGLNVYGNPIGSVEISHMTNLEVLQGGPDESLVTTVDASGLEHLNTLYWSGMSLQSVDVTGCTNLHTLGVDNSSVTQIDVTTCPLLVNLWVDRNQLTVLDVSQNPLLQLFSCSENLLTSLTVNSAINPISLQCGNNLLTELNLSGPFGHLICDGNPLTTLDLSNVTFELLYAFDCELQHLNIKNGENNAYEPWVGMSGETTVRIRLEGNPLEYICADDNETDYYMALSGIGSPTINSYCSFVPGGEYFTVSGSHKFDSNANGCDASDTAIPHQRFNITDGTIEGSVVSNNSGNYNISVLAGVHTITPQFENPTYFNVSPSSITVDFPSDGSAALQDFCISPNGEHHDITVTLMPLMAARPGFDVSYKLIARNVGNMAESGTITLTFEDEVLDFIEASPAPSSLNDNTLIWNYTGLAPFASQEIEVTLNLNSPVETPPANAGDQLDFEAAAESSGSDETPLNNLFGYKQTVVNSIDPNDITCLEGAVVGPEHAGEYVHYLVRFENTGTFAAENIVVKDLIDTSRFDINSMVPVSASHDFTTRISDGKIIEFIFENANLPFDDENNDGYVLFKIRILPSLVIGDTFAHNASIFFDYNFPVVTNTATTVIQSLGVSQFGENSGFTLYPNPAKDQVAIAGVSDHTISAVEVFDISGRILKKISRPQVNTVDVSDLSSGSYLIKIYTMGGNFSRQLIKE